MFQILPYPRVAKLILNGEIARNTMELKEVSMRAQVCSWVPPQNEEPQVVKAAPLAYAGASFTTCPYQQAVVMAFAATSGQRGDESLCSTHCYD